MASIVFKTENEVAKYCDIDHRYLNEKLNSLLGCEGSEIFESADDIKEDNFKYEGIIVENYRGESFKILIGSVEIDEDEYENYFLVKDLAV